MSKGFKINHAAIRQMMGEIQSSFDRQTITVPITGRTGGVLRANDVELWESLLVHALYQKRAFAITSSILPSELALDLTDEQLKQAVQLARDDRLIEGTSLAGDVYLTAQGRAAARRPDLGSLPTSVVHNDFSGATFTGSNVSTGSHSTQTVNAAAVDAGALAELLLQIDQLIDRSQLDAEQIEELDADIELLELQKNEPLVRRRGLRRALRNVEQLAIASVGGAAATGITQLVGSLT